MSLLKEREQISDGDSADVIMGCAAGSSSQCWASSSSLN